MDKVKGDRNKKKALQRFEMVIGEIAKIAPPKNKKRRSQKAKKKA